MFELLATAVAGGLAVALVAGPLGCFVVWRRMAYFGDTLAHSALLGVALSVFFSLNLSLTTALVPLTIALLLVWLEQRGGLPLDTLLGILSHSALAAGLVLVAQLEGVRIDLMALLFGDLLAITSGELGVIVGVAAVILGLLLWLWRPLINITLNPELAAVEGTPVMAVRTALMVATALLIAIAMKIVGVMLITALLIIPAAAARRLSHTPEQMAVWASALACCSVLGGTALAWHADTPVGPSVVVVASALFVLATTLRRPQ
jgi:zinc transport system permease protein